MKEVSFGNDGNISKEKLEDCINSDLANNFGNLCQRVTCIYRKKLLIQKFLYNDKINNDDLKILVMLYINLLII